MRKAQAPPFRWEHGMARARDKTLYGDGARRGAREPLTSAEIALIRALARRQARADVLALMAPDQELMCASRPLRPV